MGLVCLECGSERKDNHALAQHVRYSHKITILNYELKHGIIKETELYCLDCKKHIGRNNKSNKREHGRCFGCYQRSEDRKLVAKENVQNRRAYLGAENPNYRGKIEKTCICWKKFLRRISPCQEGTRTHIYCSRACKKKYSVSISTHLIYKNIKMRSSYEVVAATLLDAFGYKWEYEPESFKTPYGFYTPDFLAEKIGYIEVKGFFRDENSKLKYEWFNENIKPCLLITEKEFERIGAVYKRKKGYFSIEIPKDMRILCQSQSQA